MLQRIKELEHRGFQFEAAEGSFEMLLRRQDPAYRPPFVVDDFTVIVEKRGGDGIRAQATVKLRVGDEVVHTAAEGDGPVNALDRAVRKALLPHYPALAEVHLVDYKVRIVDEHLGTAARPRVIIESARGAERWSTVGCSENIIEASWLALCDALELALLRPPRRLMGQRDARTDFAPALGPRPVPGGPGRRLSSSAPADRTNVRRPRDRPALRPRGLARGAPVTGAASAAAPCRMPRLPR